MISNRQYTSNFLIGSWYEDLWEYEKVDIFPLKRTTKNIVITDQIKREITQELVIHEGEKWEFLPDNILRVYKNGKLLTEANWFLKGRGHILKIKYKDELLEQYIIQSLCKKEMILSFYVEAQARGIVKLTFSKK
jgi:hypothetical protein